MGILPKVVAVTAITVAALAVAVTVPPRTSTPAQANACGVERWHVKTGIDPDSKLVSRVAKAATVASLVALHRPAAGSDPNSRSRPVEVTRYRLHGIITAYKTEGDSDVHLVLSDKGKTLIAEIPNPGCVGKTSPFATQIAAVQKTWTSKYPPSSTFATIHQPVTLVGVGFFDALHGQRGVAPNGIELHPVTSLVFG